MMGDLLGAKIQEVMGILAGMLDTINIGVCGVGGMEVWVVGVATEAGTKEESSKKSGVGNLGGRDGCCGWVGGWGVDNMMSQEWDSTATASAALPEHCLQGMHAT